MYLLQGFGKWCSQQWRKLESRHTCTTIHSLTLCNLHFHALLMLGWHPDGKRKILINRFASLLPIGEFCKKAYLLGLQFLISKTWPLEKFLLGKFLMIRRVYKVVLGYFVGSVILYWKLYCLCSKYLTKMGTIKQWWYTVCYFSAGQASTVIQMYPSWTKIKVIKL